MKTSMVSMVKWHFMTSITLTPHWVIPQLMGLGPLPLGKTAAPLRSQSSADQGRDFCRSLYRSPARADETNIARLWAGTIAGHWCRWFLPCDITADIEDVLWISRSLCS
jgi:hypothetical protein